MNKLFGALSVIGITLTMSGTCFAQGATANTVTVSADGITRDITYVEADFNDPHYQLLPVLANNRIKSVDSLSDMAQSIGAVAAINGGYFNSYSDNSPQGTIERNGKFDVALGSTLMGITADNHLTFVPGSSKSITGTINNSSAWDQSFYAWGINYDFHSKGQIVIFTPEYGYETGIDSGTCIVVKQGKVAYIRQGNSYIPSDGYIIYIDDSDPNAAKYVDRFHYGDTVNYQVQPLDQNNSPVDWSNVQSALSAGPLLVQNGQVVVNPEGEGFTDLKVTQVSSLRSFVGVTGDNKLIMGTVPNVTVRQLAPLLQRWGLSSAMCDDDAASSGLYYEGQYLTTPGRDINNCLALIYNDTLGPKITMNGHYMILSHKATILNGRTVVPLRDFFNQVQANVTWEAGSQTITIDGNNTTIQMQIGNPTATVNNQSITMDTPPTILNGTTYIPLRFVAESLGKTVNWDTANYTVELK